MQHKMHIPLKILGLVCVGFCTSIDQHSKDVLNTYQKGRASKVYIPYKITTFKEWKEETNTPEVVSSSYVEQNTINTPYTLLSFVILKHWGVQTPATLSLILNKNQYYIQLKGLE